MGGRREWTLQRRRVTSTGPASAPSQSRRGSWQVVVGELLRPAVAERPACNQRRKLVSLGRWVSSVNCRDCTPSSPWTPGILLLLQALQPGSKACCLLPELWCWRKQLLAGACQGALTPQTIRLHTGTRQLQPTHASQPSRVVECLLVGRCQVEACSCMLGWDACVELRGPSAVCCRRASVSLPLLLQSR